MTLSSSEQGREKSSFKSLTNQDSAYTSNKQTTNSDGSSGAQTVRKLSSEFCYGFAIGFGLKASANTLFFILSLLRKKNRNNIETLSVIKQLLSLTLASKEVWNYGNVFGSIRFLHTYLSSKHQPKNGDNKAVNRLSLLIRSILKGILCGSLIGLLSILNIQSKDDTVIKTLILYSSGRMIDDVCKYVWPSKESWYHRYGSYIGIGTTIGGIFYPVYYEPSLMKESFYNRILKWGNNTDEQMAKLFRTKDRFYPCYPHWHPNTKSSLQFALNRFIPDTVSHFPMYGTVHGISFILYLLRNGLRNKKDNTPMNLSDLIIKLYRLLLSIVKSSLFLSTTQHVGKLTHAWIRDYLQSNHWAYGTLTAGFGGMIASLWENKSRRMAYVFYSWTQVAPIYAQLVDRHLLCNLSKRVLMIKDVWHVCLFQMIICVWSILKDRSQYLNDPIAKNVLSRSLYSYFI